MLFEEVVRVARHHLHVLGGDAVGLAHHLVLVVADDHLAIVLPGLPRGIGGRQDFEEPLDLVHGVARELLRIGEQDGGRGRAVLGLAEQVGRADFAVHAVVGDDQRLGRAGEQVDADAAEQLALGLRHIGVARADDHVDRRDRLGAERHRGDRLHAAQHVDFVGAAEVHGRDDRRMRPALERRRAGDDALHAGDPRGDDRHVRRGDHRIAAARHVAADRVHRDVPVAEDHAGQRLDLQVLHRVLLLLREVAHLRLRELDVVEVALGHLRDRLLDLGGVRRKSFGSQLSNFFDSSRIAASFLSSTSARMPSTVARTLASAALIALASIPRLRKRGMFSLHSLNCRPRECGDPVFTDVDLIAGTWSTGCPAFAGHDSGMW